MRRALIALLFATSSISAASTSSIRTGGVLLRQDAEGWRVVSIGHSAAKPVLQAGDVITAIDAIDAATVGPLAVTAAFNAALTRTVRLTVKRGHQLRPIDLWRSDGPPPAPLMAAPESVVARDNHAPDFNLPALNGSRVALSALRGKWILVSFWATWCRPCLEEATTLNHLAGAFPERLRVLAVAVNDKRSNLEAFAAKVQARYTILDGGAITGEPALSYGVGSPSGGGSVPVNVLVRPDGTIAFVQGGYEAPSPLEREVRDRVAAK